MNPSTKIAVQSFQGKNGLRTDGDPGVLTREKLFAAYMAYSDPEKSAKTDFLGRGADSGGKEDFQSCGEFIGKWRCTRTDEGTAARRKRFWTDSESRRSNHAVRREFGQTQDTMACRFYAHLDLEVFDRSW